MTTVLAMLLAGVTLGPQDFHAVCGHAEQPRCAPVVLASAPKLIKPLAVYALGEAADAVTTRAFRAHGVREANPLMFGGRPRVFVPVKVGLAIGMALLDRHEQHSSSHVRRTRVLYGIGRAVLTAWNVHAALTYMR